MFSLIPPPPQSSLLGGKKRGVKTFIPSITEQQIEQLHQYVESLKIWNQRVNLISRKDINSIWEHHIFPSLVALNLCQIDQQNWILDLGSGGGFPAIPIKILRPDLQFLLIESIRKKTLFLRKMITDFELDNMTVLNERIEISKQNTIYQQKFDLITARAVASIPQLLEWGKPFLKNDGYFLLWKGSSDIEELKEELGDN